MNTTTTASATVFAAVRAVAPELSDADLLPEARLQEDLDLDSMDFLDLVTELGERAGIEITGRDYAELSTIQGCIDYLERRAAPV